MNPDRLTQKSQEALHDAQCLALRLGHTEVDSEHLLVALIDQPDGLVPAFWPTTGADVAALRGRSSGTWAVGPRVIGPGAAPGQVFVTQRLSPAVRFGRARGGTAG